MFRTSLQAQSQQEGAPVVPGVFQAGGEGLAPLLVAGELLEQGLELVQGDGPSAGAGGQGHHRLRVGRGVGALPRGQHDLEFGRREAKALGLLLLGVAGWATDAIHHIHPVLIGLGLSILCMAPRIGPLSADHLRKINYPIIIYIGSVFALGDAFVASGASERLAEAFAAWLDLADRPVFMQLAAISYVVTPFNFLVDTAVVGGVLTPPLLSLGAASGLTPLQVGLSVAVGTGMVFMPYQGAPFMMAYAYGYATMRQFVLTMMLICLVNLIVLVPLNLVYWSYIGLF